MGNLSPDSGDSGGVSLKTVAIVVIALVVFIAVAAGVISFARGSKSDTSSGVPEIATIGVELLPDAEHMIEEAFLGSPGVLVSVTGEPVASISYVTSDNGTVFPVLNIPSEEALENTYLGDVVQQEGIGTAQTALVIQLLGAHSETNQSPEINLGDISTADRLATSLSLGLLELDDELLAEKLDTVVWMLTTFKALAVADHAISELGAGLERSQENEIIIVELLAEDRQHERETAAEVSAHSQDAIVTTVGIFTLGDVLPFIVLGLVVIGVIWLFSRMGGEPVPQE